MGKRHKGVPMSYDIFYYDVAAVAVMAVALLSFVMRRKTYSPANSVYFSTILLVTVMTACSLTGDLLDEFVGPAFIESSRTGMPLVFTVRSALALVYYELRVLTAPAYLVLIATVGGTLNKLNNSTFARVALWGPLVVASLVVLSNPLHHLIYFFAGGVRVRGPLIGIIYASAVYYSLIGVGWLFRWRRAYNDDEFATLMMLYPMVFISVLIQYYMPHLRIEMFVTSVAVMLVSAFVLQPEKQLDSLVNAASLHSYQETCRRAFVTNQPMCLVYLEIVNMEQLRELLGKDEMQGMLQSVADRLSSTLVRGDVLYYLRNGLYCIIPWSRDADHAVEIARRTHEEGRRQAIENGDDPTVVRMRSCVVRAPQDVSDLETLRTFVRRFSHLVPGSDVATYTELSQHEDFALQMALPSIVERAIRERSFEIYYQPILCTEDGRFHSAEALVRLHDDTFGWVPPALFIPEAEQSGAIIQIGNILLEKVCAYLGSIDCDKLGLSYIEVNLSVEQCVRPQLTSEIMSALHEHGVEPRRMNLEITETASAMSQEVIERNMRRLAEAGVTFSLDDYGTGYSNACRALTLPFSMVKFDRSFVLGLDDPATRTVFAQSVAMMRAIDKKVLVEGIETDEQAEALFAMGVDYLQGFRYARPVPQAKLAAFLRKSRPVVVASAHN